MPKMHWNQFDITGQLEIAAMLALTEGAQPVGGRYLSAIQTDMIGRLGRELAAGAVMATVRRLMDRGLIERTSAVGIEGIEGNASYTGPNRYRATVSLVRLQHAALERLTRTWFNGDKKRMAQAATHLAQFGAVLGKPVDNHQ